MCLDVQHVKNEGDVTVRKCDDASETQKWTFDAAMYKMEF